MKTSILDYIQELSLMDKKSLSDKVLKVFEEGGELSKKTLPYVNAHGTLHRMVSKDDLLEEVADLLLVVRSIGYDLGFSHQDIEDKVVEKTAVWANLQKSEARMQGKVPYEIHITIKEADQELFIKSCKILEVKPIVLALQANDTIIKDVMTSSVYMGDNRGAIEEMDRISDGLTEFGFKVLRKKIETVPWHSAAPSREFNKLDMPKDCYFESHLGIKISSNPAELNKLKEYCKENNLHLSKNFFKMNSDGSYTIMATYRCYNGTCEDFQAGVDKRHHDLSNELGFTIDKVITEFSIYDTQVSHDSSWLLAS